MNGGGSGDRGRGAWGFEIAHALERTRQRAAATELAQVFADTLKEVNQIDTEALLRHRDTICEALTNEFDVYDVHGGGSRTRSTYVNGLSDVDYLLDLGLYSSSSLSDKDDPAAVLATMAERLKRRLPGTDISAGRMALTIRFSDGHEFQMLPAFRYHSGYRVPDSEGSGWVVTRPRRFADLLRARNAEVGGKLLRTIKLGKLICGRAGVGVKAYHLENIALRAFDRYTGPRSDQEMLRHFFNYAKSQVMRSMADVTGQTTHVDRYLASTGERMVLARRLAAIEEQIIAAGDSATRWRAVLDGKV